MGVENTFVCSDHCDKAFSHCCEGRAVKTNLPTLIMHHCPCWLYSVQVGNINSFMIELMTKIKLE